MKFSIIIPAHNEEQRLPPVLEAYAAFFAEKMGAEAEIILVANGCDDNTAQVAEEIAGRHSNIRVIDEPGKIGKGGSVILGAKGAVGEYIGFVDADGATSAEEFFRLYGKAIGRDGVIASRWMKGADVAVPQRAMRLLSSRFFNGLTRILLGLKYKDTQCGAKIFKSEAWRAILPDIGITRFAFDVDILFQLKRHGYSVAEEPTVWKDIEGSKVRFFNTSLEMFLAIARMRLIYSPFRFSIHWYDKMLARPVEYLLHDALFRHAAILFSASVLAMIGNIGFQRVAGHMLPQEEYALMATFLALFAVVNRPAGTVAVAMNHYVALLKKEERDNCIGRLLLKWLMLTGSVSLVLAVVSSYFAPRIAAFFHLKRIAPVIVSALALPAIFVSPVFLGALRGLQRFVWVSVAQIGEAFGRVLFASIYLAFIYSACGWALAGHVSGMYIALGISFLALFPVFRIKKFTNSPKLPSLRMYLLKCSIVQLSLAVLVTGDVIFVRRFLPETPGFAYAATLSRMVSLMAAAIGGSMMPKVASSRIFTREHRDIYFRSLLYTSLAVLASLLLCLLIPSILLDFFFGEKATGAEIVTFTRGMALAMTPSTLLGINAGLLLAQRRFKLLSTVFVCAFAYLVAIVIWHTTVIQIIWVVGLANLAGFAVTTAGILHPRNVK